MGKRTSLLIAPLLVLAGCAGIEGDPHPNYVAIEPIEYPEVTESTAPANH